MQRRDPLQASSSPLLPPHPSGALQDAMAAVARCDCATLAEVLCQGTWGEEAQSNLLWEAAAGTCCVQALQVRGWQGQQGTCTEGTQPRLQHATQEQRLNIWEPGR